MTMAQEGAHLWCTKQTKVSESSVLIVSLKEISYQFSFLSRTSRVSGVSFQPRRSNWPQFTLKLIKNSLYLLHWGETNRVGVYHPNGLVQ